MGILGHGVLSLFIEFKERCSCFATLKIGPFLFYISLKNTGCFLKCFSLPVILKPSLSENRGKNSYVVTRSCKYLNKTGSALSANCYLLVFNVEWSKSLCICQLNISSNTFRCDRMNLGNPDIFGICITNLRCLRELVFSPSVDTWHLKYMTLCCVSSWSLGINTSRSNSPLLKLCPLVGLCSQSLLNEGRLVIKRHSNDLMWDVLLTKNSRGLTDSQDQMKNI